MKSLVYDSNIDPDMFDAPPLTFEKQDDYGWTAIARSIVQTDGGIGKYIKQLKKKKYMVSRNKICGAPNKFKEFRNI